MPRMPTRQSSLSLLALLCLWLLPACQSTPSWLAENSPTTTRVAFNLRGNLPFVPVTINGSRHEFLFDTGASDCVVTPQMARRLGLRVSSQKVEVRTASGDTVGLRTTVIPRLEFGGMVFENASALVHDLEAPRRFLPQMEGVVGFGLLRPFRLTLDYPNRQLAVGPGRALRRGDPSVAPLRVRMGVPQAPLVAGQMVTYADVDTGSNGGLEMRLSSLGGESHGPLRQAGLSYSISKVYRSYTTQLGGPVAVGSLRLENPKIEVTESDQRIGGAVLRDMVVTFDEPSQLMALSWGR
jgi:clan AA aspartic protease (TIGR02281 family)